MQKIGKNFNYFFLSRLCTRQESHISNPEMANIRACRVKSGNTNTFFLALEQIKCSTTKQLFLKWKEIRVNHATKTNKEVNKPISQQGIRCSNGYKMCSFLVTIVLPPPPNVFSCLLIGWVCGFFDPAIIIRHNIICKAKPQQTCMFYL